ncbi:MAG TPA: hypothetical protein VFG19_15675 [Geobacteraceae bacterium]|nr:hypothetical protein [Geobacteraceae bacterium]
MAEIKTIVLENVTMRKVIGIPTVDELMTCLKEYYAGYPTKFVVWDLSACSLAHVTADDLRQIVSFVRSYAHARLEDKTAIVAPHALEYGISRMLHAFAEIQHFPSELQIFRNFTDAAQWLEMVELPIID